MIASYKVFSIALLLLVMSVSCNKFLDLKSKSAIPDEDAITDKASAAQALRGVYRSLGSGRYYGGTYIEVQLLTGGDVNYNNVGDALNLLNYKFRSDNSYFASAWSGVYNTINRANNIIEKVPLVNDPAFSDKEKNQMIGEALFIRALGYFDLARDWGGVPLKLSPTEDLSKPVNVPRSTLVETYAQVKADLDEAEALVPEDVNRIRVTKNTVRALKARWFLYQKRWAEAEAEADTLINSSDYTLLKPFSVWFKGDVGTPESIFELEYSAQNTNGLRNDLQHTTKGGSYAISPNPHLVSLLTDPLIGGTATGRRSLIGSLTQAGTTIWYADLYYRSPATDPSYILRIAEQYLIRAEARAHNNNLEGAIKDINAVRERAGLADYSATDLPTQAATLLAIEQERRFEFLWEGYRWSDLVRTGRAKAALEADNPDRDIEPYKLLYPIPNDEVILAGLKQNDGY